MIDATNVRAADRKIWVELARRWHALPVAIVIDPGFDVCVERNKARTDRDFGTGVPQRMTQEIRRGLRGLSNEGFRQVWKLASVESIDAARVECRPMWNDKRDDPGPFDVIGDVHGYADELRALLAQLDYVIFGEGEALTVAAPHGRKLAFVGDHDRKLSRWLEGRKVTVGHGLQASIDQLAREAPEFREKARAFLADSRSHYWLGGGKLAVRLPDSPRSRSRARFSGRSYSGP